MKFAAKLGHTSLSRQLGTYRMTRPDRGGAWSVLLATLAIAGAILLFPVPNAGDLATRVAKIALSDRHRSAQIGIIGNSVIDHVSKCDADLRAIPGMLAAASGAKTLDLSYPGQSFEESVNLAGLALKSRGVSHIVLFISTNAFSDRDELDLQSALFFKLNGQPFSSNNILERIGRGVGIAPPTQPRQQPFTYKGVAYPDYNGIKARYFEAERLAMGCPETVGTNRRFIEARYWQNISLPTSFPSQIADVRKLADMAKVTGKSLSTVLLPTDFDDARALDPAVASGIARRRNEVLAALRGEQLTVVDASEVVSGEGFSDRYCACGHLNEHGRKALISFIKDKI